MATKNLLKETIQFMQSNDLKPSDVLYISSGSCVTSWALFKVMAFFQYDNSYNYKPTIDPELSIVFSNGTIMKRTCCQGSEFWDIVFEVHKHEDELKSLLNKRTVI